MSTQKRYAQPKAPNERGGRKDTRQKRTPTEKARQLDSVRGETIRDSGAENTITPT